MLRPYRRRPPVSTQLRAWRRACRNRTFRWWAPDGRVTELGKERARFPTASAARSLGGPGGGEAELDAGEGERAPLPQLGLLGGPGGGLVGADAVAAGHVLLDQGHDGRPVGVGGELDAGEAVAVGADGRRTRPPAAAAPGSGADRGRPGGRPRRAAPAASERDRPSARTPSTSRRPR